MSNAAKVVFCALTVILAGCASQGHRNLKGVPDWEAGKASFARVRPFPSIAGPASGALSPMAPSSSATTVSRTSSSTSSGGNGRDGFGEVTSRWVPLQRWSEETGLVALRFLSAAPSPTYSLRCPQGTLVLRIGSVVARWNGLELRLGFAPQLIDEQPFVHALDLKKTIQPLLQPPSGLGRKGLVVLDPGHGGADAGAASVIGGHYEKEYTLDWALRLSRLLTAQGWEVSLTRATDIEVPLADRVTFATDRRAAVFISLHFNSAAPDHVESGVETYCLSPPGVPSSLTRGYPDDTSQVFPNNAFDAANLHLGVRIHQAVLQVDRQKDRGVRRARFPAVLRGQQCPATLIEGGYLSNPREARLIAEPAYRQKLAEAVARALNSASIPP